MSTVVKYLVILIFYSTIWRGKKYIEPMSERLRNLTIASMVGIAAYGSTFAFSRGSRREVLNKTGGTCAVCGSNQHIEAAHSPTHKKDKDYDNAQKRGIPLCSTHHLSDHIKNHGNNGLTRRQNSFAINQLEKRVREQKGWDGITQAYEDAWD